MVRPPKSMGSPNVPRARTGVAGLDEILGGGLPTNHLFLIDGEPGTGKTTLGLQFLLEGVKNGERGLYVTLSESRRELQAVAESHGWTLDGVDVFELTADGSIDVEESYTIFHPAEVELQQTVDRVLKSIEEINPHRVVFDSLSEMRLLAREPLRFRRQILALKQFFDARDCTTLLLDDKTGPENDLQLHSIAHGVLVLEHLALEYGSERRRLQVTKVRGIQFRGGYHDFRILRGGVRVFPRVRQEPERIQPPRDRLLTGSKALDALLGGGITCGTSALITGAAGTGKSILCTQFAREELRQGGKVLFYLFDERMSTFQVRSEALGISMEADRESGQLVMRQVEPTELSPGEFANHVVESVEKEHISLLIIDSINGYMQSMPEERLLPIQIHELLSFLANNGVTCVMTLVQHGIFGNPVGEAADVSYLADTVILMRYFEVAGSVRQAISVVKKRSGDHERTIRECRVQKGGLFVGEPLREFQGVLTGVPEYTGGAAPLLTEEPAGDWDGNEPRKKTQTIGEKFRERTAQAAQRVAVQDGRNQADSGNSGNRKKRRS
ncbi:MAG TPA: ATPase domain-containing protein [Gemmatimonadaceae bacterium]|nr:ATPase domain-containing protein [Gemmatimonadaceae bacterium]